MPSSTGTRGALAGQGSSRRSPARSAPAAPVKGASSAHDDGHAYRQPTRPRRPRGVPSPNGLQPGGRPRTARRRAPETHPARQAEPPDDEAPPGQPAATGERHDPQPPYYHKRPLFTRPE